MAQHEERDCIVHLQMLDMSAGQGRAPETSRFATAIVDSRVEVGACHDGLRCGTASDSEGV